MKTSIVRLLENSFTVLVADIKLRLAQRDSRLDALQRRVEELEQRPQVRWMGVYQDGQQYAVGTLVTRSGSLWLATERTGGVPGKEGSGWKLVVKAGAYAP